MRRDLALMLIALTVASCSKNEMPAAGEENGTDLRTAVREFADHDFIDARRSPRRLRWRAHRADRITTDTIAAQ